MRKHLGETMHLFTHIRQRAIVQSISFADLTHQQLLKEMEQAAKKSSLPFKWVNREELEVAAVSTGMKKAFELLAAKGGKPPLTSTPSLTTTKLAGQQKSIMSFFKKV